MKMKIGRWICISTTIGVIGRGMNRGNHSIHVAFEWTNYGYNFNTPFSGTRRVEAWRDESIRYVPAQP